MVRPGEERIDGNSEVYLLSSVIADVRTILDMNDVTEQLVAGGDEDTLEMDRMIEDGIIPAARHLESSAPYYMLNGGVQYAASSLTSTTLENGLISGSVLLPDDFLRLVSFKMADWRYTVHDPITPQDPQYHVQGSRFGVKGNPQRPVVAVAGGTFGLELQFWASTTAVISEFRYVPYPYIGEVTENGEAVLKVFAIPPKLINAIEYYTASLVCKNLGDRDKAASLEAEAYKLAGITEQSQQQ